MKWQSTNIGQWLPLIIFMFLFTRCGPDAPHDNPYDPLNPSAGFNIQGQVFNYYPPFQGLPGVQLTLLPINRQAFSSANGQFRFENVKRGTFQVVGQAVGYLPDTVSFQLMHDTTITLHLDALPAFDQLQVTSHRVGRFFPPEDLIYAQFSALGSDQDGANDVVSMEFTIPELGIQDSLTPLQVLNARQIKGAVRKTATELALPSIEALIGKAIYFTITDRPGGQTRSAAQYLFRVIPQIPMVISPAGLTSIPTDSAEIVFRWEPITFSFPFTFTVEVYRLDLGIGTLVHSVTDIAATRTEIRLPNPGTPGDYFWVVYVVDELGNTSRSREGAFRIITATGG